MKSDVFYVAVGLLKKGRYLGVALSHATMLDYQRAGDAEANAAFNELMKQTCEELALTSLSRGLLLNPISLVQSE